MADLLLSGVAPSGRVGSVAPDSVLALFGLPVVPGYWSGLYGSASTREGLKRLLSGGGGPWSVFRVVCRVPGRIVTRMSADEARRSGYLSIRYADADLSHRLDAAWSTRTGESDPDFAMHSRPDLVIDVLRAVGLDSVAVVLHPVRPRAGERVLTVGTILDPGVITDIRSRDRRLDLTLPARPDGD